VIYETLQNELGADFLEKDPPIAPTMPAKGGKKAAPPVPKRGAAAPAAPDASADIPDCPSAPPAPGPPPPAPAFTAPPGATGVGKKGAAEANGRGGLLADINKGGFKLKKVDTPDEKSPGSLDAPNRPARTSSAQNNVPADKTASIMGALTQAMGERFKAVQADDQDEAVDDWSD